MPASFVVPTSPLWMQALDYSAREMRAVVDAIGDSGVSSADDLKVFQRGAGANMSVDVGVGSCVIPGPTGGYLCPNTATRNLAIAAAPSSGNERYDLVYAQMTTTENGDATNQWKVGVVDGTPSASPVLPALPSAYAIPLARVNLTSSTTSITTGLIANARFQSAPPSARTWPWMKSVVMADTDSLTLGLDYGALVIPSPNRSVTVFGTVVCDVQAKDVGSSATFNHLGINISYGSTTLVRQAVYAYAANHLNPVPVTNHFLVKLDGTDGPAPGIGQSITINGRVLTQSGGTATWKHGRLTAQMFPA